MMNLHSHEMRRDPFPMYDQVRSLSPVHDPRFDLWMIFDYEGVKHAVTDHDAFRSAVTEGMPGRWFIFADPPRHTRLRGLVMRAFTPRMVASLEPRIRELCRELLARTVPRGSMDLVADFSAPLPMMVIAEMLGVPLADLPLLQRWRDAILGLNDTMAGGSDPAQAVRSFGAATTEMSAYLERVVEERRVSPRDDLFTRLVEAEVEGERLDPEDVLGFFQLLLLAGSETTTNLISNAILSLVEHPEQRLRLEREPALLTSAIEEVLRYRSPVQATFRVTTREVGPPDRPIPPGKMVLAMLGSANRDPRVFPHPGHFDIGRNPNPHIAFGHGIHFCIGAPLARLEARVALPELLSHLKELELAGDEPWEPRPAFHIHGPARLPIRFQPGQAPAR